MRRLCGKYLKLSYPANPERPTLARLQIPSDAHIKYPSRIKTAVIVTMARKAEVLPNSPYRASIGLKYAAQILVNHSLGRKVAKGYVSPDKGKQPQFSPQG